MGNNCVLKCGHAVAITMLLVPWKHFVNIKVCTNLFKKCTFVVNLIVF